MGTRRRGFAHAASGPPPVPARPEPDASEPARTGEPSPTARSCAGCAVDLRRRGAPPGRRDPGRARRASSSGWRRSSAGSARSPRCCWWTGAGPVRADVVAADPAHELHRRPGHRQDDGGAADGARSCTRSGTCARRACTPSPATTWSASSSGTPRRRPRRSLKRGRAGCCSSTRPTTCTGPRTSGTTARRSIEILLQEMENERDDLVVIFAGYPDRMDDVLLGEPGPELAGRPPHRLRRLHAGRAGADRRADAGARALPALARRPRRPSGVPDPADAAAALRQRAQRAQRDRAAAAPPGPPAGRAAA